MFAGGPLLGELGPVLGGGPDAAPPEPLLGELVPVFGGGPDVGPPEPLLGELGPVLGGGPDVGPLEPLLGELGPVLGGGPDVEPPEPLLGELVPALGGGPDVAPTEPVFGAAEPTFGGGAPEPALVGADAVEVATGVPDWRFGGTLVPGFVGGSPAQAAMARSGAAARTSAEPASTRENVLLPVMSSLPAGSLTRGASAIRPRTGSRHAHPTTKLGHSHASERAARGPIR